MLNEQNVQITPITFTLQDKAEMYQHLKWCFEKKMIVVPPHPKLMKQTTNLIYDFTSTGILRVHHPEEPKAHDDYPDALALACLSTFRSKEDTIIDLEGEK